MADEQEVPTGTPTEVPTTGFKPNIYPVMYWALAYGAAAGVLLFLIFLLSRYIVWLWFPVFLGGLVWGGFRNYRRQKQAWAQNAGVVVGPQSPMQEFREAVGDIAEASRDLINEEAEAAAVEEEVVLAEEEAPVAEEVPTDETTIPPTQDTEPPAPPAQPPASQNPPPQSPTTPPQ